MIKLIDRYLVKTFLQPLMYCIIALLMLFVAYDLSSNLDSFIDREVPVVQICSYYLYQLPIVFSLIMPFTTLLALLYCLGNLSRSNEIMAMRASGIALYRIIRAYLILGFIMFLVTSILGELFVPKARRLTAEMMPKTSNIDSLFSSADINIHIFYNAKEDRQWLVGDISNGFENLTITQYTHSREQRKRSTLEAKRAEYIADYGWWFYDVTEIYYNADGTPKPARKFKKKQMLYSEEPEDISCSQYGRVSMMSYLSIFRALKHSEPDTDYTRELKMELHSRVATPFACFVFVLLAAPFGIFHTRAGMMKGVLTSIGLCLFYYLVGAYLINLGRMGYIMPLIASWTANIVFIIIGSFLLHKKR